MRDGTVCDTVVMIHSPLWGVVEERAALLFQGLAARSFFCLGNWDGSAGVPMERLGHAPHRGARRLPWGYGCAAAWSPSRASRRAWRVSHWRTRPRIITW